MARIIDSAGRESAALLAAEDALVTDPVTGTLRKVFAGQPVPAGLEDVYEEQVGGSKSSKGKSKK